MKVCSLIQVTLHTVGQAVVGLGAMQQAMCTYILLHLQFLSSDPALKKTMVSKAVMVMAARVSQWCLRPVKDRLACGTQWMDITVQLWNNILASCPH